jgi:hypothetical protein
MRRKKKRRNKLKKRQNSIIPCGELVQPVLKIAASAQSARGRERLQREPQMDLVESLWGRWNIAQTGVLHWGADLDLVIVCPDFAANAIRNGVSRV